MRRIRAWCTPMPYTSRRASCQATARATRPVTGADRAPLPVDQGNKSGADRWGERPDPAHAIVKVIGLLGEAYAYVPPVVLTWQADGGVRCWTGCSPGSPAFVPGDGATAEGINRVRLPSRIGKRHGYGYDCWPLIYIPRHRSRAASIGRQARGATIPAL
jgi:hypothetical protein